MRTTTVFLALLVLSTPACAHDPQPAPQTPCGRRYCPPQQPNPVEKEVKRQSEQAMRRAGNEVQNMIWRAIREATR